MTARRRFYADPRQLDLFDPLVVWAARAAVMTNACRREQHARHAAIRARIEAPRAVVAHVEQACVIDMSTRRRRPAPEPRWPALVDKRITVPMVIAAACETFAADGLRVMPRDVMLGDRLPEVIRVRHVAMFLARHMLGMKMPLIANRFGGMHHTSVLYALRKIDRMAGEDAQLAARLDALQSEIRDRAERGNVARYA